MRGVPTTDPDALDPRRPAGGTPQRGDPGRRRSAIRDVWSLAPSYLVPGLASFVVVPVLFAAIGPAEYGRWALIYAVAAGVPQVTTSWLEARVVRFGHREARSGDRRRAALAVAGSTLLAAPLAALVLPAAAPSELLAAALLTAVVSTYLLEIARLQSRMRFASVSVAATTRSLAGAVLGIAGALVTGRAWVAIMGLASGYIVGQMLGELSMRRHRAGRPEEPVPVTTTSGEAWSPPPEGAQYGIASGANATAQYTLSVGDRFVLSALRSPTEVGVYTATYALVDLAARLAPGIVVTVVRPRIFRAWDVGRTEDHGPLVGRLAALLAGFVAVAATGLAALAALVPALPVELTLVGPIGVGLTCYVAANALAVLYSAAMRQGRLAGHGLVAAAACLALNVLLVPDLGPAGAALATAGSYAVLLVLNAGGLDASRLFGRHSRITLVAALGSLGALSIGSAAAGPIPGVALSSVALLAGTPAALRVLAAIRESGVESGGRPIGPAIGPSDREQDTKREP